MLQCEDRLRHDQRKRRDIRFPEDVRPPDRFPDRAARSSAPRWRKGKHSTARVPFGVDVRIAGEGLFLAGVYNQQRLAGVYRVVEHAQRHSAAAFSADNGLGLEPFWVGAVSGALGREGEMLCTRRTRKYHGARGLGLLKQGCGKRGAGRLTLGLLGKSLAGDLKESAIALLRPAGLSWKWGQPPRSSMATVGKSALDRATARRRAPFAILWPPRPSADTDRATG